MEDKNQEVEQQPQKETGIAALDWMRGKFQQFRSLTKKSANDNVWVMGIKLFFQAIMVLILIALSPFAILAIIISMMIAG